MFPLALYFSYQKEGPPRWRKLAACAQFTIQKSKFTALLRTVPLSFGEGERG